MATLPPMPLRFGIPLGFGSHASYAVDPSTPVNIAVPYITGTPVAGGVLTANAGVWLNDPTGFTYQWAEDGAPVRGANLSTYTGRADTKVTFTVAALKTGHPSGVAMSAGEDITASPTGNGLTLDLGTPQSLAYSSFVFGGGQTSIVLSDGLTLDLGTPQSLTYASFVSGGGQGAAVISISPAAYRLSLDLSQSTAALYYPFLLAA